MLWLTRYTLSRLLLKLLRELSKKNALTACFLPLAVRRVLRFLCSLPRRASLTSIMLSFLVLTLKLSTRLRTDRCSRTLWSLSVSHVSLQRSLILLRTLLTSLISLVSVILLLSDLLLPLAVQAAESLMMKKS